MTKKIHSLNKEINNKNKEKIILLSIFIFYLVLGRLLIHSGDDWAWGGTIGYTRLVNKFDAYNGRYLGNLIELAITRNMFIRLLIYGVVNTGIIFFIKRIIEDSISYVYIFLMILLMPVTFYSQTYGWLAGFANYNTSTFFLLWILWLVNRKEFHSSTIIGIFILSIITQLFSENVTIASLVLSGTGILFALLNKEKIHTYLSWFAGAILGALIMFSNNAYHMQDNMRGFSNISISSFVYNFLTNWTELYVKQNVLLILLFSIVIFIINGHKSILNTFIIFFPSLYFIMRFLLDITWKNQSLIILIFEAFLIFLFLGILILTIVKSAIPKRNKIKFFYFLIISVVLVGPFLIVTPFGPRNILTSFIFLLIALFQLTSTLIYDQEKIKQSIIPKIITITLVFCYLGMHVINKYEEHIRVESVHQEVKNNSQKIILMRLPYEFLGHDLTPPNGSVQSNRQKKYYKVPTDIDFKIVDYHDSSIDNLRE